MMAPVTVHSYRWECTDLDFECSSCLTLEFVFLVASAQSQSGKLEHPEDHDMPFVINAELIEDTVLVLRAWSRVLGLRHVESADKHKFVLRPGVLKRLPRVRCAICHGKRARSLAQLVSREPHQECAFE